MSAHTESRLASIKDQLSDYTAANEEEFDVVQSAAAMLTAIVSVLETVEQPDIVTNSAEGDTAYLEASRIRTAIETALRINA